MKSEISILLPTYNNSCYELVKMLSQQCESIDALQYEIIVADDGSTLTDPIIENRHINALPHCQFIERAHNVGRAAIRNVLTSLSQYENLLFLDSDIAIPNPNFIRLYLDNASNSVVYGGISNTFNASLRHNLRYRYERLFESRHPASVRNKKPYLSFRTTNFLATRTIMTAHPFDDDFKAYGYEDVLFGKELKSAHIPLQHIHNPVEITDYENNLLYIEKTEEALRTLSSFQHRIGAYSGILRTTKRIADLHLLPLLSLCYHLWGNSIRRHLCSRHPSLLLYQFYRILYFASLQ